MTAKTITAICHGALPRWPTAISPWSDVWLRWKGKPRRKVYYAAPCLCGRDNLDFDRMITEKCAKDNPEFDYSEDIAREQAMADALERQPYAFDDHDMPNVYTRAAGIDRAEAERMLRFFLRERHGLKDVKFRWKKPRIHVFPFGP